MKNTFNIKYFLLWNGIDQTMNKRNRLPVCEIKWPTNSNDDVIIFQPFYLADNSIKKELEFTK